ncbi:MAG: GGDEF domain-containing protein [Desulfuromonadales bacterium]|nr:MAG: GGDEF domain-containing protein [Desulfuromonadales bacterium]
MAETDTPAYEPSDVDARYAGYDRIMGSISWLLIALVSLDIKLMQPDEQSTLMLAVFCLLLFVYNVAARYFVQRGASSPFKTFVDLMVFLCFIVGVSWFTGKITSPFVSLLYLVLMATSLTQGKRVTYFMVGLAISSYVLLSSQEFLDLFNSRKELVSYVLQLFPFMLIAHLGAMLSGEAENARKEIEKLSFTDEVTGLNNMRNFFLLSDIQEKLAKRYRRPFTICMIDADNLKKINDTHGHFAGTELIRHTGRLIVQTIRCTDIPARYGGDEFVIMYVEATKTDIGAAVERLITQMRETPFEHDGTLLSTTLSAGIASFPEDGDDVATVMARADEAMYVSKRRGKNMVTVYGTAMGDNGAAVAEPLRVLANR